MKLYFGVLEEIFEKELELFKLISEEMYYRKKQVIDRILYASPIGHSFTQEEVDERYKEYDAKYGVSSYDLTEFTTQSKNIIQRHGDPSVRFASPDSELSLPPAIDINNITRWEVIRAIPSVESSTVAPRFDQPGGGVQFFFENHQGNFRSIEWLLQEGFIRQLPQLKTNNITNTKPNLN